MPSGAIGSVQVEAALEVCGEATRVFGVFAGGFKVGGLHTPSREGGVVERAAASDGLGFKTEVGLVPGVDKALDNDAQWAFGGTDVDRGSETGPRGSNGGVGECFDRDKGDPHGSKVRAGGVFDFVREGGGRGVPRREEAGGLGGGAGDDSRRGVDAFNRKALVEKHLAGRVKGGFVAVVGEFEGGLRGLRG